MLNRSQNCVQVSIRFVGHHLPAAAVVLSMVVFSAGVARGQEQRVRLMQQAAKAWTMSQIAAYQASVGEFQDAKHTVSQIDEQPAGKCPADVTVVWFCNGQPIYDHPPAGARQCAHRQIQSQAPHVVVPPPPAPKTDARSSAPAVPVSAVSAGLPKKYLAADPRHGRLVAFSDERDAYGTRVTTRRYADGVVVIETLKASTTQAVASSK